MTILTLSQNSPERKGFAKSFPFIHQAPNLEQAVSQTVSGTPVVVINLPPTEAALLKLCHQLEKHYDNAPFSAIDIIQASPQISEENKPVRQSLEAHPAHTDGNFEANPPQKFLLQFAQVDSGGGGSSLFWPIQPMLNAMPSRYRSILSEHPIKFCHLNRDGGYTTFVGKVFFQRPNGKLAVRYATDRQVHLEPVTGNSVIVQRALAWMDNYIQTTAPLAYQAKRGDIIIVDNDVLLHGRSAISPEYGNQRMIRRVYLECAEFFIGL